MPPVYPNSAADSAQPIPLVAIGHECGVAAEGLRADHFKQQRRRTLRAPAPALLLKRGREEGGNLLVQHLFQVLRKFAGLP